ncbi:MAG TPA: MarR family transcriptional regulator [Candidatus Saccharimonadales bacterium]|nr:MarR family transcriptional regulator [Candidatus Saccharimonadales bacterium]
MVKRNSIKIGKPAASDGVDKIIRQWACERPDLDTSPVAIVGRISRIEKRVAARLSPVFRQFGLEQWSFDVLATLRRSGYPYELTPTQLFSSLMLSSGAITHRGDELVKVGLVQRKPDPNDRRGVRIKLTAAGLAKINEAVAAHIENEHRLLRHLSRQECSLLASLLRRLLLGLEHSGDEQKLPKQNGDPQERRTHPKRRERSQ